MKNLILIAAVVSTVIMASCDGGKKKAPTIDSMTVKPKAGTIDSMTVTKTITTTIDSMTVKPK